MTNDEQILSAFASVATNAERHQCLVGAGKHGKSGGEEDRAGAGGWVSKVGVNGLTVHMQVQEDERGPAVVEEGVGCKGKEVGGGYEEGVGDLEGQEVDNQEKQELSTEVGKEKACTKRRRVSGRVRFYAVISWGAEHDVDELHCNRDGSGRESGSGGEV
ncbi:hypothetical protein MMC17_008662 [Xylographa soralifera]|nr:hypothetical protein [Xylographa soralifera]